VDTLRNTTIDTKIQVRLEADRAAVQRRVPAPWQVAPASDAVHRGTNLLLILSEVWLRQQADGSPAPDAVNRHAALLVPALHGESGETAVFMVRMYAAHPASVPGRFGNSVAATVWRDRHEAGTGLRSVCTERFVVRPDKGGHLDLRVRYERGIPVRRTWPTAMRSAADPAVRRRYHSEALLDVVRSVPAGIDRVDDYALSVTIPELSDLFDGSERLISLTAVPWFVRRETD
jgi:hypothetical protein